MSNYKSLPFWGNLKRQKELKVYQESIEKYFDLVDFNNYSGSLVDNDESKKIRTSLNKQSGFIQVYLVDTGVSPYVVYTPPPAIGGYVQRINLIENLFNLFKYDIEHQVLIDTIDKAIGVYERDLMMSVLRTLNPFFWSGKLLELIASIPFYLLGSLGFNRKRLEKSSFGKVIKWLIKLLFSILTLLGLDYALVGKNTFWTINFVKNLVNTLHTK